MLHCYLALRQTLGLFNVVDAVRWKNRLFCAGQRRVACGCVMHIVMAFNRCHNCSAEKEKKKKCLYLQTFVVTFQCRGFASADDI